jgi:hypothetical protein
MIEYCVGVDVAKMANKTSVSILSPERKYLDWRREKEERDAGHIRTGEASGPLGVRTVEEDSEFDARMPPFVYVLRWLQVLTQPPEGESYVSQAARLANLLGKEPLSVSGKRNYAVAIDASGVGQGLVDALEANSPIRPYKVIIVGGRNETYEKTRREYHVARNNLIMGVRAALQEPGRSLEIAHNISSHEELIREGQNLQLEETRASTGVTERVGHIRDGVGDDRVFSTALAVWLAKRVFTVAPPSVARTASSAGAPFKPPSELPFSPSGFGGGSIYIP